MRADGEPIADVARRAGVNVEEHVDWLEEVEPQLATRLLAAEKGDVVGPVTVHDRFVVAVVRTRTSPTPEDETVLERVRRTARRPGCGACSQRPRGVA